METPLWRPRTAGRRGSRRCDGPCCACAACAACSRRARADLPVAPRVWIRRRGARRTCRRRGVPRAGRACSRQRPLPGWRRGKPGDAPTAAPTASTLFPPAPSYFALRCGHTHTSHKRLHPTRAACLERRVRTVGRASAAGVAACGWTAAGAADGAETCGSTPGWSHTCLPLASDGPSRASGTPPASRTTAVAARQGGNPRPGSASQGSGGGGGRCRIPHVSRGGARAGWRP
mmetsp:Transcript_34216/g.77529  ORF Transcript_34216/g.77529 Transcript_34216/m.77529 type:complete len:232 (+) Transcript_34216:411-1106(+)